MAKQVLVIGGSYFVGRVFSIFSSQKGDPELHVVNRGNMPLNKAGVHEYRCERHDVETMASILPDIKFDAVVDLCAYAPGDIKPVVDALADRIGQYLYVSTASVYVHDGGVKKEGDPLMYESEKDAVTQRCCGNASQTAELYAQSTDESIYRYCNDKAKLETELIHACNEHSIPYTILRPTFIYGPFNYAPRESWFVEKLVNGKPIERITDATSHFSFVYVGDVARAIDACIADERAYNQTFNVSAPETVTYDLFYQLLRDWGGSDYPTVDVTVRQTLDQSIPLPFPLEEDELYDGSKLADTFDFEYTPLAEGLGKAFNAFRNVYEPR